MRGRVRPRRRSLLAILIATLLLAVPLAQAFAAADESSNRDYVLEVQVSPADAAVLSRAYAELGRVDFDSLDLLEEFSDAGKDVARSYDRLLTALEETSLSSTFWLLEDAPVAVMRSFEEGKLPLASLFGAARDVVQIETGTDVSGVTLVQTVDSAVQLDAIQEKADKLESAIDDLDEDSVAVLDGTFEVADLSSKKLHSLAADGGSLAEEAQLELDRDLAGNLPDLSDQANGELDPDFLCPIPWEPSERLLCAAMGNFERLNEAYKDEFGTDLPILNGYRTLNEQYYVHSVSPSMTAIPGTSNHGLGQAIDFDWDVFDAWTDPEVEWMIENGPDYGFRLPSALGPDTDRPEPWHYEFGTSYSDDNSADFLGHTPDVVYRVISPWNK